MSEATGAFSSYDAKLLSTRRILANSEAHNEVLRGEVDSLSDSQSALRGEVESLSRSRSLLQDEVAALKGQCSVLPHLQSEMATLRSENEALKKRLAESDVAAELLRKQVAESAAAAKVAEGRFSDLRTSVDAKIYSASERIFAGTKAHYAPLMEKVRAFLAGRDEADAALFREAKYQSLLAHFKFVEDKGFKLPEGMMEQFEQHLAEAKVTVSSIEEVEITEEDLVEPSRLAVAFSFREFDLDRVWVVPKGFEQFGTMRYAIRPALDEMLAEVRRTLQEDVTATSSPPFEPAKTKDGEGVEPK